MKHFVSLYIILSVRMKKICYLYKSNSKRFPGKGRFAIARRDGACVLNIIEVLPAIFRMNGIDVLGMSVESSVIFMCQPTIG